MGLENIRHVVVVMFENRSFDNLLGWLYDDAHPPQHIVPADDPRPFDGLKPDTYANQGSDGKAVFANAPTHDWPNVPAFQVPKPDPQEGFDHISRQIFGTPSPGSAARPTMSGFLADYATTDAGPARTAEQIMQSYTPGQASVINSLARSFAVCDAWFAAVPAQTWPNRGFVHTGSADGHINNDDYEPYDVRTIFNVLEDAGKSWAVFCDTFYTPSLTHVQFLPQLGEYLDKFPTFGDFQTRCKRAADAPAAEKLPTYSFIEPRFLTEWLPFQYYYPSDYHPPHDVGRGEQFLASVYQAVRNSPYRDDILLVITFDEHGGCYDHVGPPEGAAAPEPGHVSRYPDAQGKLFDYHRYGVRVPTLLVSSYVQSGTVFRAPSGVTPFDHTSILATLRDWLGLAGPGFLPSPRIAAAPKLDVVLTLGRDNANRAWPDIVASRSLSESDEGLATPLNDVQRSLLVGGLVQMTGCAHVDAVAAVRKLVHYGDAHALMRPLFNEDAPPDA